MAHRCCIRHVDVGYWHVDIGHWHVDIGNWHVLIEHWRSSYDATFRATVDVCRECTTTRHRRHEYTASSDKIHEETRRLGEATDSMVELLEEMKRAISGVKEMKQRVRNRKDNNINVTREVFATLRKAIDEREEQTIADIEEEAYKREKALEVITYDRVRNVKNQLSRIN